ncbi:MAG TPA: hypothetical protein VED00_03800 [archaeon]|nr:hypothetical protein [archaeon]
MSKENVPAKCPHPLILWDESGRSGVCQVCKEKIELAAEEPGVRLKLIERLREASSQNPNMNINWEKIDRMSIWELRSMVQRVGKREDEKGEDWYYKLVPVSTGEFIDKHLGKCVYESFYITNDVVGGYSAKCEDGYISCDFLPSLEIVRKAEAVGMNISLNGKIWSQVERKNGEQVTPEEAKKLVKRLQELYSSK